VVYKAGNQSGNEMNDGKPEWYARLNPNERRIIDIFIESKGWCLIARPVLHERLCKTKLMDQKTLTDRLDYLIDRGLLGKAIGKKRAVFYAPKFVIEMARNDPMTDATIDRQSPRTRTAITLPIKVPVERVSAERMTETLIRSAEDWEKFGVGTPKEKQAVYDELRRLRKKLKLEAKRARDDD